MYWHQLFVLNSFVFFQFPSPCSINANAIAPKSKRDTSNAANGSSLHTISVVPSYITLSPYITDIYFQCYVNRLTARYGQTLWVRFGLTVSCNKTERVFACGNVLFIKQLVVDDAGKYRCVLNGSEATFKTVAVFVPASLCNPGDETVSLSKGEDNNLDCCMLNGSYPLVAHDDVYWNYNGRYIARGTTLPLEDFDQNQTGLYECTAYNGYGIPATKRFFVSFDGEEARNRSTVQPTTDIQTTVQTQTTVDIASAAQCFHPTHLLSIITLLIKQGFDGSLF